MEVRVAYTRVAIDNILYATDFSRYSDTALPYAISIAQKYGSHVFAVHVVPRPPVASTAPLEGWQEVAGRGVREANDQLSRMEPLWKEVTHETVVRTGDVWNELAAVIEDKKIDLVITGTRGRSGVGKFVLGSVAESIFRQAPCPVLTVGPNVHEVPGKIASMSTILYPTDFSAESLAGLRYAISLAQENQSRLYLLHVTEAQTNKIVEGKLRSQLLDLIPPETELWCEAQAYIESGDPADEVLKFSEGLNAHLIVLGVKRVPRPASRATHLPMATAYKIVSRANCPVLTVRE